MSRIAKTINSAGIPSTIPSTISSKELLLINLIIKLLLLPLLLIIHLLITAPSLTLPFTLLLHLLPLPSIIVIIWCPGAHLRHLLRHLIGNTLLQLLIAKALQRAVGILAVGLGQLCGLCFERLYQCGVSGCALLCFLLEERGVLLGGVCCVGVLLLGVR